LKFKPRLLLVFFWVLAVFTALAPVCVLAGGETVTETRTVELSEGALVEVIGENAEVRIHPVTSNVLDLVITMNNREFVDYQPEVPYGNPAIHFVISVTTSTGGATRANSVIEIGIPSGVELVVRTTNRPIVVDGVSLSSAALSTSDGKITVTNSSGKFDLNTTNSQVMVNEFDGVMNIATTNAHVWFAGVIDEGTNSISTTNGDIAVRLGNDSNVTVAANTHNGDVSVNGSSDHDGVLKRGDRTTVSYQIDGGNATLNITNGPGAIHINPDVIAVFDGDG